MRIVEWWDDACIGDVVGKEYLPFCTQNHVVRKQFVEPRPASSSHRISVTKFRKHTLGWIRYR